MLENVSIEQIKPGCSQIFNRMQVITADSENFLRRYLNNASPTGFEWSGQQLWLDYLRPYLHEWQLDNYGTAYGIINPGQPYKVVIEGHADEISWFVNYISDDGFIYVIRNGGSDHLIAPSMRVWVHLRKAAKWRACLAGRPSIPGPKRSHPGAADRKYYHRRGCQGPGGSAENGHSCRLRGHFPG